MRLPRRARLPGIVLAGTLALAGLTAAAITPTARPAQASTSWVKVWGDQFQNLDQVYAFQSSPAVNSTLSPSDTSNSLLQKPTVASDVQVVPDPTAQDGWDLAVTTQQGIYETDAGPQLGWTNGRMMITGEDQSPPVMITARMRFTQSVQTKSAIMWWPAASCWPWEVDFAETFGGAAGSTWANRQEMTENWHSAHGGCGATPQLQFNQDPFDATQWHVYSLYITPSRMWETIDGTLVAQTTDPAWIPTGSGFFSIGKALTGVRDGPHTPDAVYVDWVRLYKPS